MVASSLDTSTPGHLDTSPADSTITEFNRALLRAKSEALAILCTIMCGGQEIPVDQIRERRLAASQILRAALLKPPHEAEPASRSRCHTLDSPIRIERQFASVPDSPSTSVTLPQALRPSGPQAQAAPSSAPSARSAVNNPESLLTPEGREHLRRAALAALARYPDPRRRARPP